MKKSLPRIALCLLAVLFAVNVYRAATQSITIDEAFSYNLYIAAPFKDVFTNYDAANHVLYTLLARTLVRFLGSSELVFRLPSLLGGLIFFTALYRLSRRLFGDGLLMLLAVAVLGLNPYMLDFLSAARGYGLAIGLFLCALLWLLDDKLWGAGVALGLSIAANLTMLFPVAAVILVFGAPRIRERRLIDELVLPAVVVAGLVLVIPLSNARADQFYYGAKSIVETCETLVYGSLIHHPDRVVERFAIEAQFLAHYVLPILAVLVALSSIFFRERIAATFVLTLAMLVAANRFAGVLYPYGRTGLYLWTLLVLGLLVMTSELWKRRRLRPAAIALAIPLMLAVVVFALRWNIRVYSDWPFNASTRQIVTVIRQHHAARPGESVTVGGSWLFEPGLNFYRHSKRLGWMQPVKRGDPGGQFDYYVLLPEDRGVLERLSARVLYVDARSGAVVAYTEK